MSQTPPDMVGKALLLLTLLGDYPDGASLSEVARRAGFPLSTAHRLASALVRDGYACVDETSRRYRLGLQVFSLASRVAHRHGFAGSALPVLRRLAEQTSESALMSVIDGHHQLYVHHVQGRHSVSVSGEPGRRGPLHCTSMGKVLVAFAPEAQRDELVETLELTPFVPRTIVDRQQFRDEIRTVADQGYAIADEEHEAGIRAIGVPVKDLDGATIASVSVAAPAYRVSREKLLDYLPDLNEAARELTILLPPR
ncbi:IclR family transcriptional regulator [Sinomonas humi]|uniref:IclR family transcriptional regulator n=1 Tax=Sinomonas humi TaxID=1338436 RepID=A0A0B2AHS6_9MICC|nr:IclR family transcriptional regulator [Sinomonas humi]KHL01433.1 IclR family transcriptional regulator [Sinomonas humi]